MRLLKRKRKQAVVKQNYRGIPTHACPCGSVLLNVKCIFEDYEIVLWFTEAECAMCGALVTAPTPGDWKYDAEV
jgi:ribosomal protein S27E